MIIRWCGVGIFVKFYLINGGEFVFGLMFGFVNIFGKDNIKFKVILFFIEKLLKEVVEKLEM